MYFAVQGRFQLSPSAQMYMRVGRITMQDVYLSFERRDTRCNLPRCGSARIYATAQQMENNQPVDVFDIYALANDPSLHVPQPAPPVPQAFSEFVEGMDISL